MTAMTVPAPLTARRAPLPRLMRSELRMMLRRPRTLIGLGLLALVPVVAGIGIAIATDANSDEPMGQGLETLVAGNGLLLPVFALVVSLNMLLPLTGAMLAADALAGETAHGTLRNLLTAPVGRARLLAVKAFGVATVSLLATLLMAVTGTIAGILLLGGEGMLTSSGTQLPFLDGVGRVLLTVVLVTVQVWALAAVALAVSAWTEHPLIVVVVSLGLVIVSGVLSVIPALDWLDPVLITTSWQSVSDVVRDPLPTGSITEGLLRAACYIVIGYSLALSRILTRDG
ncbi:ABC transporter permease [Actinokineospora iranica]|uniref:ABC-2 type transport system permease protein n=1 Tax=Actinokineospora iranica TaxID=1271860 RepID=A0A1G6R8K6_9PSEU|nr:ABC transporter permease subunit [Actinokineospora iranica]SDD00959.1 ABC-2 type transport system permease protein [Actinokineospora iranica]